MEAQFGFTTFATERISAAGTETGAVGSLIYSLSSNNAIKNISDLKGKRIGVGRVLVDTVFALQFKVRFYLCTRTVPAPQLSISRPSHLSLAAALGPRHKHLLRRRTGEPPEFNPSQCVDVRRRRNRTAAVACSSAPRPPPLFRPRALLFLPNIVVRSFSAQQKPAPWQLARTERLPG